MKKALLISVACLSAYPAQSQTDSVQKVLAIQQSQLAVLKNLVPKGSIIAFAGDKAPQGWAICDGSLLPTSQYPELFASLGYRYGGSGNMFAIPDLRDDFIRGASGTRAVGNREQFATARGNLTAETKVTQNPSVTVNGQYQSGWPTGYFTKERPFGTTAGDGNWAFRVLVGQSAPNEGEPFYFNMTSTGSTSGGLWSTELKSTDSETRPRNVSMNYIIKL